MTPLDGPMPPTLRQANTPSPAERLDHVTGPRLQMASHLSLYEGESQTRQLAFKIAFCTIESPSKHTLKSHQNMRIVLRRHTSVPTWYMKSPGVPPASTCSNDCMCLPHKARATTCRCNGTRIESATTCKPLQTHATAVTVTLK